ncbi:hypothetical protein BV898_17989 [Hypsibius exemplaris]|uniref:non-specific serine/threonine protein kinase n=1 Tax=Hypsibius exemplaris TaxID=2072580 RepID=A0A9X6NIZ5_HYPEX|nr:hypothetical protein BV898_17989 [Hypsibius exemplaris]
MEQVVTLATPIFKTLCKLTTTKVVHGLHRSYPELSSKTREEVDADIEDFYGNSFAKLQLALEQRIAEGIEQTRQHVAEAFYTAHRNGKYEDMRDCLTVARREYQDFLRNPSAKTLEDFRGSEQKLYRKMVVLYEWIVNNNAAPLYRAPFLKGLTENCKLEEYTQWQRDILLLITEAYYLRVARHYYSALHTTAGNGALDKADFDNISDMQEQLKVIVKVLDDSCLEVKTRFLTAPCGGVHDGADKGPCGIRKGVQCFELGARVYKGLGHVDKSRQELASDIAKELRKAYPHFEWSVVVVDKDHGDIELQSGPASDMRCLRFSSRENSPTSAGSKSFGCLVCYRSNRYFSLEKKRTALVFWGEADAMWSSGALFAHRNLDSWVSEGALRGLSGMTGASQLQHTLEEMKRSNRNYALGIAVRSIGPNSDVGFAPAKYRLGEEGDIAYEEIDFPFCKLTDDAMIVIIPEPLNSLIDPTLTVVEDPSLQPISTSAFPCVVVVKRGFLLDDSTKTPIVIKDISVLQAQNGDQQANTLFEKLGTSLSELLKLRHINIVRHLLVQSSESNRLTSRVVMQFCSGGTLTAKMAGAPLAVSDIKARGTDILNGLAFLHALGTAHKYLYADHVMLHEKADGQHIAKLISIPRIPELLPATGQSYNPCSLTPCLPKSFYPPANERVGRPTDTWHFGCLLIQMVSGQVPETKREERMIGGVMTTVPVPQIPKGTPRQFAAVIERCLEADYAKRQRATVLASLWSFWVTDHAT